MVRPIEVIGYVSCSNASIARSIDIIKTNRQATIALAKRPLRDCLIVNLLYAYQDTRNWCIDSPW